MYKTDKTIFGWIPWYEGSPINCPSGGLPNCPAGGTNAAQYDAWTPIIAAYIKSQDSNHLVIDGSLWLRPYDTLRQQSYAQNIDALEPHYYPELFDLPYQHNFTLKCQADYAAIGNAGAPVPNGGNGKGQLPLIVGGFGDYLIQGNTVNRINMEDLLTDMLPGAANACRAAGAAFWVFGPHGQEGGFNGGFKYFWPGFSPNAYDNYVFRTEWVNFLQDKAYKIEPCYPATSPPTPPTPGVANFYAGPRYVGGDGPGSVAHLTWRGSFASRAYVVERSTDGTTWNPLPGINGLPPCPAVTTPYTIPSSPGYCVAWDNVNGIPVYGDPTASPGGPAYTYRFRAVNANGALADPAPESRDEAGPIKAVDDGMIFDTLDPALGWNNYIARHTGVAFLNGAAGDYGAGITGLTRSGAAAAKVTYQKTGMKFARVTGQFSRNDYAFGSIPDFIFSVSSDNTNWNPVTPVAGGNTSSQPGCGLSAPCDGTIPWWQRSYTLANLPVNSNYLRITWANNSPPSGTLCRGQ
jgi:hypothetical protein